MAINQVCHIEWNVTDLDRSQRFYEALFGWQFQKFGDEMVVFGKGKEHIGGLTLRKSVENGSSPSVWLEADDIERYIEKAEKAGGSLGTETFPVPGVGWSAVILDPDRNQVGLIQFDRTGR